MEFYTKFFKTDKQITSDTIICLDFEVSSFWLDHGKVITYDGSLSDEYYNSLEKCSVVYIWQICIDDVIYYGRELNDLKIFLDEVQKRFIRKNDKDFIYCHVHNLAYEFQFLRNLYNDEIYDVFARTMRKPMKCKVGLIEFRCTYFMTNMSLALWGKQLGLPKLSGQDFNYKALRSPLTKLSKSQLDYCERDIKVMIIGLRKLLEEYKTLKNIPMTNTGQVRRVVKNIYKKDIRYKKYITSCLPKTADEYKIYKAIFAGGDTHANITNVNKVLKNIASFDETSAYPYMMFAKKFPSSRFFNIDTNSKLDFDKYAYIFFLKLENVRLKKGNTLSFLSTSRTVSIVEGTYDNGRIVTAKTVYLYCTEQDYKILHRVYDFKEKIITLSRSRKIHLDRRYVIYMLDLLAKKTTLRGIDEFYDLYLKSKNRLNSLFGMLVCDIIQAIITFNGDWHGEGQLTQDIQTQLDKIHKKFWNNYFSYTVGCWITAYGRSELWNAILSLDNPSRDVVYFDTDSVKFKDSKANRAVFDRLNAERMQESIDACKYYGLDLEAFQPKNPKGEKSILGQWDFEGVYKTFKTLGAKKYMVEKQDGTLEITVAGVPKDAVKQLKSVEEFKPTLVFRSDSCKKMLSTYLDGNNPIVTLEDGYTVNQPFGINMREIGYTLNITKEFEEMIFFMWEHGEI